MKNLKISQKLLVGFGTVLFMLLLSMVAAFMNLNTIQAQVTNYSTYTVPNNDYVWYLRRDMTSIQRYLLMALAESNQQIIVSNLNTVEEEAARINSNLAKYEKTTRADLSKVEQIKKNVAAMEPSRKEIDALLRRNSATDNASAYTIFVNTFKPIMDETTAILTELGEFQNNRATQQAKDANAAFATAIFLMIAVGVVAVIVTIVVTSIITKSILIPVKQVQRVSLAIANGDLHTDVDYDGKDELGEMAHNMRNANNTLQTIIADVDALLTSMGNGDFTVKSNCTDRYVGEFANILTALKKINSSLSGTLSQINEAAGQVSVGADQVSVGAQALSQGATEQASSIQELSASITEVADKIKTSASQAIAAKEHSDKAIYEVEDSNQKMSQMISAMKEIDRKSTEISKIIKTIEDIAFQTNILALNAAVEAARAGAAGKGFAVVADEVRNLAGKSADAAKSTTALIEETVIAVRNGTRIADGTASSMLGVVSVTREVTGLVVEIAASANQQALTIGQITSGVDQISSVIQTNSATAEESAAASEELSGQASMMKSLVSRFKIADSADMATAVEAKTVIQPPKTFSRSGGGKY